MSKHQITLDVMWRMNGLMTWDGMTELLSCCETKFSGVSRNKENAPFLPFPCSVDPEQEDWQLYSAFYAGTFSMPTSYQ